MDASPLMASCDYSNPSAQVHLAFMTESPTPSVSIITPLYNSSATIAASLDSVRAQTYPNWEVVLVDDGSTDGTRQQVEPYLRDPRISYRAQRNQGIAGARNAAIRAARGAWVCLLDHDDRWLPTKLERQLDFVAAYGLDIASTDAVVVRGDERSLYSEIFRPDLLRDLQSSPTDPSIDVFALLIQGNFLCASSVMLRKSLFDRLGLLDPACAPADDYEMWLRCLPGARLGYLHEPLIEYYLHERNYSNDRFRMLKRELYALHKTRATADPKYRTLLDQQMTEMGRRAASAYLHEYRVATQAGRIRAALPPFWKALRVAPREVLRPRRLAGELKNGLYGLLHG
jgi:glycosyltransferase involved in cell wall biosynthesis